MALARAKRPTIMKAGASDWKAGIIGLLEIIASKDKQLTYEADVPVADVPAELLCLWFNSLYHPEASGFRSCFKQSELETLAVFNKFYAEKEKLLPQEYTGIGTWLQTEEWREVMKAAEKTLETLRSEST
jgi:hypothetical protein